MTLYQRKNSTVEAIQWTCDNYEDVKDFTSNNVALTADNSCVVVNGQNVCDGDWILKFAGQETSVGPTITRYSVMTNAAFQDQYEPYEGYQP